MNLKELLKLDEEIAKNLYIRVTTPKEDFNPEIEYKKDPDEFMLLTLWCGKPEGSDKKPKMPYNKGEYGLGFVKLRDGSVLMTDFFEVLDDLPCLIVPKDKEKYDAAAEKYKKELLANKDKYFKRIDSPVSEFSGRLKLKMNVAKGAQCRQHLHYDTFSERLEVLEITPLHFSKTMEFPGFENITLSWEELSDVVNKMYPSWVNALKSQQGVYVIADNASGKLYVGSATSKNGGILKRWSDYVSNGHGGDVELRNLVKEKGFDYVKKNFQYTLVEHMDFNRVDVDTVLNRESFWKEALLSRKFGYNKN